VSQGSLAPGLQNWKSLKVWPGQVKQYQEIWKQNEQERGHLLPQLPREASRVLTGLAPQ
jgi:hypothetical protein